MSHATTFGDAVDTLKGHAKSISGQLGKMAATAKDAASETLGDLRDGLGCAYEAGAEKARVAKDCTVDYVRENPMKSLLLAIGVGAFAGVLLTRRR